MSEAKKLQDQPFPSNIAFFRVLCVLCSEKHRIYSKL